MNKFEIFINGKKVDMCEEAYKQLLNYVEKMDMNSITSFLEGFDDQPKTPTIDYYIERLAEKWGWPYKKVTSYLEKLYELYPMLAIQMVLKEIAIDLDKNYKGHIKNSEHIFVISTGSGEVVECNKEAITTYDNFAAFRTREDALFAKKVLEPFFRECFNE